MLEPIERRPLYQEVEERLRDFIRAEELRPGQKLLSERELAARLGVSRTSVRQALTALRVAGIVQIRHGDGIYLLRDADELVGTLARGLVESHAHLPAINEVREALDPHAARLAAGRRTDADLAELAAALREMRDAAGDEAASAADLRFHRAVVVAAGNEVLGALYEQLAPGLTQTSQASLARPGQIAKSLAEHEAVLDAIAEGDEQRAELSMRLHVFDFSDLQLAPRRH